MDYATWTWIGSGAFRLAMIMMCQVWSTVEVEILPVYTPTKEEIDEPLMYARNVRDYIAKVGEMGVLYSSVHLEVTQWWTYKAFSS